MHEEAKSRPFTAVFVGRCEPRKGLHYALKAWHDSGAAEQGRFIICGSFMEGYREALGPLLNHSSVEFRGFVSDVQSVMQSADILLLPAVEEGSALVTYEARGAGCVLLVSESAGAVCRHGYDSLIHRTGDVEELTRQLKDLLHSKEKLENLRANSLAGVNELTWDHAASKLLDCYRVEIGKRAKSQIVGGQAT